MREDLYRGRKKGSSEWVYGYLAAYDLISPSYPKDVSNALGEYYGETPYVGFVEVDPDTVGPYTTVDDRKGEKIFAGDIVKTKDFGRDDRGLNHPGYDTFVVVWHNAAWCIENSPWRFRLSDTGESLERIGNRWDNPELLEEVT